MGVVYLPSLRSYLALSKSESRQLDATVSTAKSCLVLHDGSTWTFHILHDRAGK